MYILNRKISNMYIFYIYTYNPLVPIISSWLLNKYLLNLYYNKTWEEVFKLKRVAIIGAILENPKNSYNKFNDIVKDYQSIIRGRMGLPFKESKISVISLTVVGTLDEINSLTGKLGNLENISVKTSISKKEICD